LSIHGSLSTGCRICFSEDIHSHISHAAHLRIQWGQKGMEVLQMLRRKAEKRIVELSPDEARLLREALLAFRNKLLSAGKPTEDVNELIIKVMK
jgi:hypothetical protein